MRLAPSIDQQCRRLLLRWSRWWFLWTSTDHMYSLQQFYPLLKVWKMFKWSNNSPNLTIKLKQANIYLVLSLGRRQKEFKINSCLLIHPRFKVRHKTKTQLIYWKPPNSLTGRQLDLKLCFLGLVRVFCRQLCQGNDREWEHRYRGYWYNQHRYIFKQRDDIASRIIINLYVIYMSSISRSIL